MVEELQADASAEPGICGTADAAASVEERGIAVFARACCRSQDADERADGLFSLAPEYFACFL